MHRHETNHHRILQVVNKVYFVVLWSKKNHSHQVKRMEKWADILNIVLDCNVQEPESTILETTTSVTTILETTTSVTTTSELYEPSSYIFNLNLITNFVDHF